MSEELTLSVGDKVTRLLAGTIPMELTVTEIDDMFIHCGPWKFDKWLGYEVDEVIGWGRQDNGEIITGSILQPFLKNPEVIQEGG